MSSTTKSTHISTNSSTSGHYPMSSHHWQHASPQTRFADARIIMESTIQIHHLQNRTRSRCRYSSNSSRMRHQSAYPQEVFVRMTRGAKMCHINRILKTPCKIQVSPQFLGFVVFSSIGVATQEIWSRSDSYLPHSDVLFGVMQTSSRSRFPQFPTPKNSMCWVIWSLAKLIDGSLQISIFVVEIGLWYWRVETFVEKWVQLWKFVWRLWTEVPKNNYVNENEKNNKKRKQTASKK